MPQRCNALGFVSDADVKNRYKFASRCFGYQHNWIKFSYLYNFTRAPWKIHAFFPGDLWGAPKKQVKHYIFLSKKAENGNFHLIMPAQRAEIVTRTSLLHERNGAA